MKVLLTLLVLILATNIGAAFKLPVCPIYNIGGNNTTACYHEELGKLTLKKCGDKEHCEHMKFNKESYCQNITKENLVHGESCENDTQCASKKCNNKICKGLEQNEPCKSTAECGSNLFCNKTDHEADHKVCTKTGTNCNEAGEGCSTNQFCYAPSKTCHTYMTKDNGESAVSYNAVTE